ncbi:MAG: type II secretion system F family protein [bacterium]|nr:type II secretion system F family protein [bacterium]
MNKDTLLSSSISLSTLRAEASFFDRFAQLIASDVPLLRGIEIAAQEIANKELQQVIKEIKLWLEQGESITDAFRRYPNYFSKFAIAIIDAGEREGKLDENCFRLAESLRREIESRKAEQQQFARQNLHSAVTPQFQLDNIAIKNIASQIAEGIISAVESILEHKTQQNILLFDVNRILCAKCRSKLSQLNSRGQKKTLKKKNETKNVTKNQ